MNFINRINPKVLTECCKIFNLESLVLCRGLCTTINSESPQSTQKGGFAKAFDKYTTPSSDEIPKEQETFASLLKNSKFVDLGDPEGKVVTGKITHVVNDDLYIDFGWKFHCVCQRPSKNGSDYVRGSKVRLRIKDLELSTKFLGSTKDLTILEADCQIIGLISAQTKSMEKLSN